MSDISMPPRRALQMSKKTLIVLILVCVYIIVSMGLILYAHASSRAPGDPGALVVTEIVKVSP